MITRSPASVGSYTVTEDCAGTMTFAGPTFDSTSEGRGVPVLDAVVSRSADRRTIVLKLVNTDLMQDLYVDVRVR